MFFSKTPLINRRSTNHQNAENLLVTIMIVRPPSLESQSLVSRQLRFSFLCTLLLPALPRAPRGSHITPSVSLSASVHTSDSDFGSRPYPREKL